MSTENNAISIDEAIESGDPELIAQALAFEESNGKQTVDGEAAEVEGFSTAEATDPEPAPVGDLDDDAGKAIESKSGKHTIPYSVLESEREANKQLREQLEALSGKHESNEQALQNVRAQLEAKGLDTDSMFANPDDVSDDEWKELEEDYGAIGKLTKKLLENQQAMQAQIQGSSNQAGPAGELSPVMAAIEANTDLSTWQQNDPDRWTYAVQMDEKLKTDPNWQSKSLEERFAHAADLTKTAFGDSLESRANKVIQNQPQAAPDSLTDIGGGPTGTKTDVEALSSMTAEQIDAAVSSMSKAQVDALFEQGF